MKLQTALQLAAHYQNVADRLIEQHGRGCRASWVSSELSEAEWLAKEYRNYAERVKRDLEGEKFAV